MKNRPIPLILFGLLQIMMPAYHLFYGAWFTGLTIPSYTQLLMQQLSLLEQVEFFLFFPVAGVAVLVMKPWGYFVYSGVVSWTLFANSYAWTLNSQSSLGDFLALNGVHILCLLYFLHPKVRRVFFDHSVRWWESAPRYLAYIDGVIINNDIRCSGEIVNISRGGALLRTGWGPELGEALHLNFEFDRDQVDIGAKVVHTNEDFFGVQFFRDELSKSRPSDIAWSLRRMDLEEHNPPLPFRAHLSEWVGDLKNGRGFTPEV